MASETVIGTAEMRARLAELTTKAHFENERFVVERKGVPIAVLLGIDDYRDLVRAQEIAGNRLQQERRRLAAEMDTLRERIGPLPLTVADLVNAAREENEERYAGKSRR